MSTGTLPNAGSSSNINHCIDGHILLCWKKYSRELICKCNIKNSQLTIILSIIEYDVSIPLMPKVVVVVVVVVVIGLIIAYCGALHCVSVVVFFFFVDLPV